MVAEMKDITTKYNPKYFNDQDVEAMADLLEDVLSFTDSLDEEVI